MNISNLVVKVGCVSLALGLARLDQLNHIRAALLPSRLNIKEGY
jgi:hypothetical protein